MRLIPLILAGLLVAGCATPENRRELTGPYYPYEPIPFKMPVTQAGKRVVQVAPKDTTVWYGPDTRRQITGRWGQGRHLPDLNYPQTPPGIKERVISRINPKGLRASKIATGELVWK